MTPVDYSFTFLFTKLGPPKDILGAGRNQTIYPKDFLFFVRKEKRKKIYFSGIIMVEFSCCNYIVFVSYLYKYIYYHSTVLDCVVSVFLYYNYINIVINVI